MKIVFTVAAKGDLDELRSYLQPLSPTGLAHVVGALESRIVSASMNPGIGRPTPCDDVREMVEPKYGFVIPYLIRDGCMFVLRIYRSERRPLDYAKLVLP